MSFIVDKQTLNDLGIFSHKKEVSVYALYNNARTRGGAQILEEMFYNPLDNYELIGKRAALIDYFQNGGQQFIVPFRKRKRGFCALVAMLRHVFQAGAVQCGESRLSG